MHKAILTAAALALSAPLAPALAHDDDDYDRYSGYSAHSRFHDELKEAHERAYEEGFSPNNRGSTDDNTNRQVDPRGTHGGDISAPDERRGALPT